MGKKYNKQYVTLEARAAALVAFKNSYEYVKTQNAKNKSYMVELNIFADQSPEDFSASRLGFKAPMWKGLPHLGRHVYSGAALPSAVDWMEDGAVNEPKDQGSCGSCWTFSTTGALEGAWKIANGELLSLSQQQLVDCAHNDGNSGCHGGNMDAAFTYLEKHPVCTDESYPYVGDDFSRRCHERRCTAGIPAGMVSGYQDVSPEDMEALMEAVSQQPVSVGIEADQQAFQLYQGGVLTADCGSDLDHAVLLVGYGTDQGVDYWKIKNSWGPYWGEMGFVRIKRGGSAEGECGVTLAPTYPVVRSTTSEVVV